MFSPNPMVFINGKAHESVISWNEEMVRMEMDCIYLVDLQLIFGNLYEVPLENEWNHVEVTYVGVIKTSILKASGVHVIKQERSTEDIQFAGLECSFGVHVGVQIVVSVVTKKTNLLVFEKLNAIGL